MEREPFFGRFPDAQANFVLTLKKLTENKSVKWFKNKHDVGYLSCFLNNELIVFEVQGGEDAELIDPSNTKNVHGISALYRNENLLWLHGQDNWEILLEMLKNVESVSQEEAILLQNSSRFHLFDDIDKYAKK